MPKIADKNVVYKGSEGRESPYDIEIPENWNGNLILFIHGYMGFKDWGCWHLAGDYFVKNGFSFVTYNASHNGGTVLNPIDFPDTQAFSQNSYTKELEDFECIVTALEHRLDTFELHIIGHSRGGGIAALQSKHPKVKKWASWAGISSISNRFPKDEQLKEWRENTFRYVKNGRTHQNMPHHFDQYLDFEANRERLNIEAHCRTNEKPCLILHGKEDTSVLLSEGENLANWTNTELITINNAQHTFNASHPWNSDKMPEALEETCRQTLLFFAP
jgi:pimeloyl-ACP methyl ester carboxylesterase